MQDMHTYRAHYDHHAPASNYPGGRSRFVLIRQVQMLIRCAPPSTSVNAALASARVRQLFLVVSAALSSGLTSYRTCAYLIGHVCSPGMVIWRRELDGNGRRSERLARIA
jgi:hypothetical protein